MEDSPKAIVSPLLSKPQVQKQFKLLEETIEEAQKRVDISIATNPDVLKAIETVERFLRKKKRVCYGGQAINSLLPRERRFYDEKYDIPDYDFFTPNPLKDIDELIDMLEKEGFEDVNKKVGVHEGTMKVYVNFIPVADLSLMNPHLFKIIQSRAMSVEGILYCDPDFLRMMMYLELSRPRGEVERWKKVYERLTLLNHVHPPEQCNSEIKVSKNVSWDDRRELLDYVRKHKRVLVGPEVLFYMEQNKSKTHFESLVRVGGPVLFLTEKMEIDAIDLKDILGDKGITLDRVDAATDQLFSYISIRKNREVIAILFKNDA